MIPEVRCKEAENNVRIAFNVRGLGEVMAETVDGHPDGPSGGRIFQVPPSVNLALSRPRATSHRVKH